MSKYLLSKLQSTKELKIFTYLLFFLLLLFSYVIIIWGFNKGFDIQDAGFYLLRYQKNQPLYPDVRFEHVLIHNLLPSRFLNIIFLRYLGLFLNICGIALFSFGLFKYLQLNFKSKPISYFTILFFNLSFLIISYTNSPSDLSYNSLNAFVFFSSVALLLLGYCYKKKAIFLFFSGFLISLSILIKISSGLVAIIIFSAIIIVIFHNPVKKIIAFLGGSLVLLLTVLLYIKPNFISFFYDGYSLFIRSGMVYNENLLLFTVADTIYHLARLYLISAIISCLVFILNSKKNLLYKYGSLVLLIFVLFYAYDRYIESIFFNGRFSAHLFILLLFSIINYFLFQSIFLQKQIAPTIKKIRINYKLVFLGVFLFFLPFAGAFGHNHGLMSASKYYYVFYGALFIILYQLFKKETIKRVSILFAFFLIIFGAYSYVQFPYRLLPLYDQNIVFKGVKYDKETATFLKAVEKNLQKNKFIKEQGIIAAYTMPGLVYLMGSYSPGGVLWSKEAEDFYFENLKTTSLKSHPFIFINADSLPENFIIKLEQNSRINFKKQYEKVIDIKYPNNNVFSNLKERFYIYAPIERNK